MYQKCRIEIVDAGEEDGGKNGGCGQLVSARTSRIEGIRCPQTYAGVSVWVRSILELGT